MRKYIIGAGVLILLLGGWWTWQSSRPKLSNEAQIVAAVEGLRTAIANRSTRGALSYFSSDFTWNGLKRSEIQPQISGAFFQWRDVQSNVTDLKVEVTDDTAIATGKYSLAFRASNHRRPEAYLGSFKLHWKKRNGQWLIVKAENGTATDN